MTHWLNKILFKINLGMRQIYPRPAIKFAIKHFEGKQIIATEVGVFRGENAASIAEELNLKRLYLIDPYEEYKDFYNSIGSNYYCQRILDDAEAQLFNFIDSYPMHSTFLKTDSLNAINQIEEPLDFAYIDANHHYDFVKKDMEAYWKKIKPGGILAGDDFHNGQEDVIRAVSEFAVKNKLKLYVEFGDWWFIKT